VLDLNLKQIEKLSDLFMDLSKGLFLAALTIQILKDADLASLFRYSGSGIIFAVLSLKLLDRRK